MKEDSVVNNIEVFFEPTLSIHSVYTKQEYTLLLATMCKAMNTRYSIILRIVSDATMHRYTSMYLQSVAPTNILSFEGCQDNEYCIELVLSLETMNRECVLYQQERKHYTNTLLAHGIVHGLGFIHGEEMTIAEEQCLNSITMIF